MHKQWLNEIDRIIIRLNAHQLIDTITNNELRHDTNQFLQLRQKVLENTRTFKNKTNYRHPKTYIHFLTSAAEQPRTSGHHRRRNPQYLEQPIRRLIPKPRKGVTSRGSADVLQRNLQRTTLGSKIPEITALKTSSANI